MSPAIVVAALLVVLSAAPAAARSIVLQRFAAAITVEQEGDVRVVETLDLRFEGSWNGIVRSIPVDYRTPAGFHHRLLLDVVAVTDAQGQRLRRELSRRGPDLEVKIWVPGASDAVRTVVLHYRVRNALRFFERHDELYWNVTGHDWEFPILAAEATILVPDGSDGVRASAFTGAYGSRQRDATVKIIGNAVRVGADRDLGFRQGLTVVVGWPKGLVREPGWFDRAGLFARANWPLGLPLVALGGMLSIWLRRGRDPRRRPVSVRYEPPPGLSPAEVGTLLDHRADMPDITATIVDLAVRGHVEIEEGERSKGLLDLFSSQDYVFRRRIPEEGIGDLRSHEHTILNALFRTGDEIRLSDLEHVFYKDLPPIRDRIYELLMKQGHYDHRPDHARRATLVGAAVLAIGGSFLAGPLSDGFGFAPFTLVVAALSSAAVVAAFAWLLPARTVRGTRALEEILGFQEFLDRVETDRLERLPPTPETFERYLPYAMALGVERSWARAFEPIVREPPQWYRGRGGAFHCRGFVNDLDRMSTRAATVLASAPRSSGSSGFGGGGFSGGGFGGGGGRGF